MLIVHWQLPDDLVVAMCRHHLCRFMKFDQKYTKAMQQVFGRILLCKDLATATSQARLHRLSCVTPSGEKAHYRGAIECGFVDASKTRIEVMHAIAKANEDLEKQLSLRRSLQAASNEKQNEITTLMGEAQKLRSRQQQVTRELQDANAEVDAIDTQAPQVEAQITETEAAIASMRDARKALEEKIEARTAELGTPLKCDLTPEELSALSEASTKIVALTEEVQSADKELQEVQTQLVQHQSHLNDNLLRRQRDVEARRKKAVAGSALDTDSLEGRRLGQLRTDLAGTERKLEKLERQTAAQSTTADKLSNKIVECTTLADTAAKELESLRSDVASGESALREAADNMSQLMRRRQTLRSKKDETSRKIADLGSVPSSAVQKFQAITSKRQLRHELKRITAERAQYSNVNKKALDQYVNFTERRDNLIARRDKLDSGKAAIEELIEVLNRRKDESITRTFTDVQKHFQQVFQEIVHDGSGRLIMEYSDEPATSATGNSAVRLGVCCFVF